MAEPVIKLQYGQESILVARPDPNCTQRHFHLFNSFHVTSNPRHIQRGGKPVIYVFSPIEREVSVKLSLVPQWELSAIYPVVPVKHSITSGQELEWVVRTSPCGTLTEKTTGLDVSYLFWEADVRPPSPPPSPQLVAADGNATELFVPNEAHLSDDDSVLVQTSQITPYLDSALKSLGLHTEARTSFITYWLPSILKHQYIALRFLPQSAYEKAAPLRVTPSPDVVLRIFMLFKGVQESQLGEWTNARTRQNEDVSRWRSVVGADVDLATNFDLFRVIEWGGMEVKDFVGA
ncbi:ubiquitin family protein [Coprinopsis cinerea okayama7|uniref:Ubiquitin family protein n=1 Tax=Coprinopsis cinerea (strain Okayama-7 / 130 / ATCC MYA-4618 / FGSC 9003) TaxID=240176 RepID=D6RQL2_COPC7|nr:ubiquitin family protein [Coprinopsis cinerea okayama7\|eukprot:XP_002910103.1 ubiquitin family protein [Coprinopsis cinerea okayama7\